MDGVMNSLATVTQVLLALIVPTVMLAILMLHLRDEGYFVDFSLRGLLD
jgi:ABC-type microcin C transport system permease subunit YejB